jgi:hypothetical protein
MQGMSAVREQFYGGTSWEVKALLKHAHLGIQNEADNMKQAVSGIFQMVSAGYCFWHRLEGKPKFKERGMS